MTSSKEALLSAETWIFDLDNTLYPASCNLFAQVDRKMGDYIATLLDIPCDDARALQKTYFREHGTTLRGLMLHHAVDPADFLHHVHDIDYSPVPRDDVLDLALGKLPGRKLIFTNGTVAHAGAVLDRLGVADRFDAVFDIVAANYVPKPDPEPYHRLIADFGVDPAKSVMVEDIAKNLVHPAALGMHTVWVRTGSEWATDGAADATHIHYETDDLTAWLTALVAEQRPA